MISKQTVRPIEDFWKLLAKEAIDEELNGENNWPAQQREKARAPARRAAMNQQLLSELPHWRI